MYQLITSSIFTFLLTTSLALAGTDSTLTKPGSTNTGSTPFVVVSDQNAVSYSNTNNFCVTALSYVLTGPDINGSASSDMENDNGMATEFSYTMSTSTPICGAGAATLTAAQQRANWVVALIETAQPTDNVSTGQAAGYYFVPYSSHSSNCSYFAYSTTDMYRSAWQTKAKGQYTLMVKYTVVNNTNLPATVNVSVGQLCGSSGYAGYGVNTTAIPIGGQPVTGAVTQQAYLGVGNMMSNVAVFQFYTTSQ